MKAKKVYEMIDPYAPEEDALDIDVSYKNKVIRKGIENWFAKWTPNTPYIIDKYLNITAEQYINLADKDVDFIPDNLTVQGSLILTNCKKIHKLPKGLKIQFALILIKTNISELPDDLRIKGNLDISNTQIYEFKRNPSEGKVIIQNTKIKYLADNLTFKSLVLKGNSFIEIPENLTVDLDLSIVDSAIKTFPSSMKVGRDLDIRGSSIEYLPDYYTVPGFLNLYRCKKIKTLPENLTVDSLYIENTGIKELPDSLTVISETHLDF